VLRRLEEQLLPDQPAGCFKPHKKFIKDGVDAAMKRIMAERKAAEEAAALEAAAEGADAAARNEAGEAEREDGMEKAAEAEQEADEDSVPGEVDRTSATQGTEEQELVAQEPDEVARPKKRKVVFMEDEEPETVHGDSANADNSADAAGDDEAYNAGEDIVDDEDGDDDPEAPQPVGKPTEKGDGKLYYRALSKSEVTMKVGEDVYLENNKDIPYVARLQEIYAYAFAPRELYFNAHWYYREGDTHEYARMAGAKGDVQWEGARLEAEPKELFFSLHADENHADCILRSCKVYFQENLPEGETWSALKQHEYLAWRAFDTKKVYGLSDLPNKKLRDAYALEKERTPALRIPQAAPPPKKKKRQDVDAEDVGALSYDELRALTLPRKHVEVWLDTSGFKRIVMGTMVRCVQKINNVRTFFVGYVADIKRTQRPYKLGKKFVDVALQVRTSTGFRLSGIDSLSNEQPTDSELSRFKVALLPAEVRKKLAYLQEAMQEDASLFEEEEVVRKREEDERLRRRREEAALQEQREHDERARKEREREDLRRRQAQKLAADSEKWWLKYQHKGDSKQREVAKLRSRLERFEKIVNSSAAAGERDNAERLAKQARDKLQQLEAQDDAEEPEEGM